jgi:hypothetical protein
MSLVKPKSDKTLGQTSLIVATKCANMSPTKVVGSFPSIHQNCC